MTFDLNSNVETMNEAEIASLLNKAWLIARRIGRANSKTALEFHCERLQASIEHIEVGLGFPRI